MVKVLVVDDEMDVRETFSDILSTIGCDVQSCATSTDAIKVVPRYKPDLVLLDMNLRGATGSLVLAYVRGLSSLARTKIVIVSGHPEMAKRAVVDWGADSYISKPVTPETLRSLVQSLTGPETKAS